LGAERGIVFTVFMAFRYFVPPTKDLDNRWKGAILIYSDNSKTEGEVEESPSVEGMAQIVTFLYVR